MSRPSLTSLILSVVVCGILVGFNHLRNIDLENQVEARRKAINQLESGIYSKEPPRDLPTTSDQSEEFHTTTANFPTREGQIAQIVEKLDRLATALPHSTDYGTATIKMMPDFLTAVKDLSIEELLEIADTYDIPITPWAKNGKQVIQLLLYLVVADQDPSKIIEREELLLHSELAQAVIGSLARTDPDLALDILAKDEDFGALSSLSLEQSVFYRTLMHDINKGIEVLRQIKNKNDAPRYGAMLFRVNEDLNELADAFANPENNMIRSEITKMLLSSANRQAGVSGVRNAFAEYELPPTEVAGALQEGFMHYLDRDEMLTWFSDPRSPEELQALIPMAIDSWAKKDFNAAGEWVGKMASSPIKDDTIATFAKAITNLDPEAATIWSHQIQDHEKRLIAMEHSFNWWKRKDPESAQEWLDDNDLDPAELESNAP